MQIDSLEEFHHLLCGLSVGQFCELPYNVFELLFPPGEPDDGARVRAYEFARNHGCEIDNRAADQKVVFTKRITNPPACV
jgi:hypothetical protein